MPNIVEISNCTLSWPLRFCKKGSKAHTCTHLHDVI